MRKILTLLFLIHVGLPWARAYAQPIIGGFVEAVQAARIDDNTVLGDDGLGQRSYPRSELRVQLTAREAGDREDLFIRVDIVSDATGTTETVIDLREAYIKYRIADWFDLKAGRQVATWGTGDLVFVNDLFAKDWLAFFTGLDDTYLKPPQDLLRLSMYGGGVTFELAASPHFAPDNLPAGERLSVYNPFLQQTVAADAAPVIVSRPTQLENGELFARISGWQGDAEWALYGYNGFWPTPQGATMAAELWYPRLSSFGASLRMPLGSVLAHGEFAAYVSRDDSDGDDPLIANSQMRGFVGLEKNLGREWTVGMQYFAEWMRDYDSYQAGLADGMPAADELQSTVTGRIGKWAREQTVYLSVFGYWGVTAEDWHLRPALSYAMTDAVKLTVGGILVGGDDPDTMFGQFRDNSNLFGRLRYSF